MKTLKGQGVSHLPIIDKEMWEAVQLEIERRKNFVERYNINKLD